MENCGIGYQNYLLSATLTANGVSSLPVSNLQNHQGAASMAWRIAGEGPGWSADFTASFSSVLPIRVVSLHRTNLTSAASWRIQIRNGITVVFDQIMHCNVSNGQCLYVLPTEVSGNAVGITVWDSSNPDGFISVPLAYVGPLWQPVRNFSTDSTSGINLGIDEVTALSGSEFPQMRWIQRKASIAHQSYGAAETATLREIQRVAASGENILFLPDPGAASQEEALFGRLSGGDIGNPYGPADRRSWTFTLTERL